MPEWFGITLFWILLYGYLIIASIDFGAGFFASYETLSGERYGMGTILQKFLSPFWESLSVVLLVIMMVFEYFYSDTVRLLGAFIFIPGIIALFLMLLRGVFFLLMGRKRLSKKEKLNHDRKAWAFLYGLTGLLIPVVLSSTLTVSEGGYIDTYSGHLVFHFTRLLTSFYSWSVSLLAIVSVLYISSMFLSFYAARVKDDLALEKLRGYAIFWSGPTVLASALAFIALEQHNPEHFMQSLNVSWMFLLSLFCLLAAVTLVFQKKRLGLAFLLASLQFFFAFFGYGISHLPYIIYPFIKLKQLSHFHGVKAGIYSAVIMSLALLLPSLILVCRLVIFRQDHPSEKKVDEESQ